MDRSDSPHRVLLCIAITLALTTAVLPTACAAAEPLKPSARATQLLKEAEQNKRLIAQAQQSERRLEDMYGTEVSFSLIVIVCLPTAAQAWFIRTAPG